ncbi:DNA-binding transcriptional LysR family regulator [Crossiella equi]|uniref:DNA-binding transcriptional LysR family regulator n=1 Tax=Crossiella equi TaxID=130796 RepID=A0ABS5AH43_9PSEU|nr:LysR family transcriptional regulator [Crossiella equi]MBP2475903.1 DNA-binding transcriptional LysR family regulator [Crossiella equi]
MDIEFRHLKAFRVLAEELNFTRAAARLGVPQSGLSRQVQRLERALGVSLLRRNTRSVALTAAGHALYTHARRAEELAEQLHADVLKAGNGQVSLRLATFPIGVAELTALLTEALPDVQVGTLTTAPDLAVQALERGDVDLVVGYSPPGAQPSLPPGAQAEILLHEPIYVALSAGHRCAGADAVHLAELAVDSWVAPPADTALAQVCSAVFASAGIRPHVLHVADSANTVRNLVAAGQAVSLATPLAGAWPDDGVRVLPVDPPVHRPVWAAWLRRLPAEVVDAALIATCTHYAGLAAKAGDYWERARRDGLLRGRYWNS